MLHNKNPVSNTNFCYPYYLQFKFFIFCGSQQYGCLLQARCFQKVKREGKACWESPWFSHSSSIQPFVHPLWFCLEQIIYALTNLRRQSELLCMRTSCHLNVDACQHQSQCCVLVNLFYLMCVYKPTCTGNLLFLLRDKTVRKLKRKAFLHEILKYSLWVTAHGLYS